MKKTLSSATPFLALVLLLLSALYLMGEATEGAARFEKLFSLLLVINVIGLVILCALVLLRLHTLMREVKAKAHGALLTAKLVIFFCLIVVPPLTVVYYFSTKFVRTSVDRWFDVKVELALNNALELSQSVLDLQMRERYKQINLLARNLSNLDRAKLQNAIDDAREMMGANEITLFADKGTLLGSSNIDPSEVVPSMPTDNVLLQLQQSESYIGLETSPDDELYIKVALRTSELEQQYPAAFLHALFPIPQSTNELASVVEREYAKYQQLAYLRDPLKLSFTLVLTLVLLLCIFSAIWAAFYVARKTVLPLSTLAKGTQLVAEGDLETRLASGTRLKDELHFLLEAFNKMTLRLKDTRDAMHQAQNKLDEQRAYLDGLFTELSTGVISLDAQGNIIKINAAGAEILSTDPKTIEGNSISELKHDNNMLLARFCRDLLKDIYDRKHEEWRTQIELSDDQKTHLLLVKGKSLLVKNTITGYVLVFDDISKLVEAERLAAWSEVAKRLAHEIKNPLTPIRLSAERLRHKYLSHFEGEDRENLKRLTTTIMIQVDSMREMVNAFSDYAKAPSLKMKPLQVNTLVSNIVDMYEGNKNNVNFILNLSERLPCIIADHGRIRQILHNLFKNALDAIENDNKNDSQSIIRVNTRLSYLGSRQSVELTVEDNGNGFDKEILTRVFEPYVSTKDTGTGLGLAIVKRIVEEHGGIVYAGNKPSGGAYISINLPLVQSKLPKQVA